MNAFNTNDTIVADRLQAEFAKSADAGWNMVNDPSTWIEDSSWINVREELINRQVLFACLCGNANITYDQPVTVCEHHEDDYDTALADEYGPWDEGSEEDDDYVTTSTIYGRALAHFGNEELAREAATMYPGDFM